MNTQQLITITNLPRETLRDMFSFLFDLQESGLTNMWGASSYLEDQFDLERKPASKVLVFWIKNYKALKEGKK